MQPFEVLQQLENCYDAMRPAQEKSDQACVWLSGIPHPFFNVVMHLSCLDPAQKVDALLETVSHEHPLSFWVHPGNQVHGLKEVLQERRFTPVISCPLMAWLVQSVSTTSCDICPVLSNNMDAFMEITARVLEMDGIVKEAYAKFIGQSSIEKYLLYVGGHPISTGILVLHGNMGVIFNIAVLPEYQKKGYGRAVMRFLMNRAISLGLHQLVLLSSPSAEKFYLDLGFEKIFDIDVYAKD
jgi:GNAT superfamily N-acetyltransferase